MDDPLKTFADSGSAEAFKALVTRYAPVVHAQARSILRDDHAADDVTQAVFIMLARKARRLKPGIILSGWLHIATRYAAKTYRRSRNRREHHEQQAATIRSEVTTVPPTIDTMDTVHTALSRLSASDRNALLLRHVDGLSTPDIATRLGLSEEATKKRLSRATARLRQLSPQLGNNVIVLVPLQISAPSATWVDQLTTSALSPTSAPDAVALADGALSMMRNKLILLAATPILTATLLAGAAIYTLSPSPSHTVVLAQVPPPPTATPFPGSPATPVILPSATTEQSPNDVFLRLSTAIKSGDEKAALDCLMFTLPVEESGTAGYVRLSAAQNRLSQAWRAKYGSESTPPELVNLTLDQAMAPMVAFLSLAKPSAAKIQTDEITLRLGDLKIPASPDLPVDQFKHISLRFKRTAGVWRVAVPDVYSVTVAGELPPRLKNPKVLQRYFFGGIVTAIDAFIAELNANKFADASAAKNAFYESTNAAIQPITIGNFTITVIPPPAPSQPK